MRAERWLFRKGGSVGISTVHQYYLDVSLYTVLTRINVMMGTEILDFNVPCLFVSGQPR